MEKELYSLNEENVISLVKCASASEFLLRLSVIGDSIVFSYADLDELLSLIPDFPCFMRVLAELVSNHTIFDGALIEYEYGIDYWVAVSFAQVDSQKYRRFKVISSLSENPPTWGWRNSKYSKKERTKFNSDYAAMAFAIADKIERVCGNKVPSIDNFRNLIKNEH